MLYLVADGHFIPQSLICPFCSLEFDMIADIDNFTSNLAFLAGQLNIEVLALQAFSETRNRLILELEGLGFKSGFTYLTSSPALQPKPLSSQTFGKT